MQLFEFGKMRQSKADLSRRNFVKKAGIAVCGFVTSSFLIPSTVFGYELPSAVQAENGIIQAAWGYVNIPESYRQTRGIQREEAIAHILGINPGSRGDPNFKIVPYTDVALTSPVYFILRDRMKNCISDDEEQTAIKKGNQYITSLLYGIGNLVSGKYMEARDYFAKNIFEIAKLNDNDYKQIEKTVGSSVDRVNFYKAFNSMSFEHRTWILNNVVWNKVKDMPLPVNQYDPKDPGLALKNFYYSLGFLGVAEKGLMLANRVSLDFFNAGGVYDNLKNKFKYITYDSKLIWGK